MKTQKKQIMSHDLLAGERGVYMVLLAFVLPVLLAIGTLTFDLGRVYILKSNLQNIADMAALAGIKVYSDSQPITPGKAGEIKTQIEKIIGLVVRENDQFSKPEFQINILNQETGFYNETDKTFTVKAIPDESINAVRVVLKRNLGDSFLKWLIDVAAAKDSNIQAAAIANSKCPEGFTWNGKECFKCPDGTSWNGTTCFGGCPPPYTWNGSTCFKCPDQTSWNGSQCAGQETVSGPQCPPIRQCNPECTYVDIGLTLTGNENAVTVHLETDSNGDGVADHLYSDEFQQGVRPRMCIAVNEKIIRVTKGRNEEVLPNGATRTTGACTECMQPVTLQGPPPSVTCSSSANPVVGTAVTWSAGVMNGKPPYAYHWTFDDNDDPKEKTNTSSNNTDNLEKTFKSEGLKKATIEVTTDGKTVSNSCVANVTKKSNCTKQDSSGCDGEILVYIWGPYGVAWCPNGGGSASVSDYEITGKCQKSRTWCSGCTGAVGVTPLLTGASCAAEASLKKCCPNGNVKIVEEGFSSNPANENIYAHYQCLDG